MFGEYGIYCAGKMVALICDDQLFVKSTEGGKQLGGDALLGSPYPGAKPCFLILAERWNDSDWLTELIKTTAMELPLPKKKVKRT